MVDEAEGAGKFGKARSSSIAGSRRVSNTGGGDDSEGDSLAGNSKNRWGIHGVGADSPFDEHVSQILCACVCAYTGATHPSSLARAHLQSCCTCMCAPVQ